MPAEKAGVCVVNYDRLYVGSYYANGYWHAVAGTEIAGKFAEAHATSRDPDRAAAHVLHALAEQFETKARETATRAALAEADRFAAFGAPPHRKALCPACGHHGGYPCAICDYGCHDS